MGGWVRGRESKREGKREGKREVVRERRREGGKEERKGEIRRWKKGRRGHDGKKELSSATK